MRVAGDVAGAALAAILALDEHISAVGKRQRGACVLLDQHDGDAAPRDLGELGEYSLDEFRRKPGGRLVEHQRLRPDQQGAGDRQHLPLAAGEPAGHQRSLPRKIGEHGVHGLDPRRALRFRGRIRGDAQIIGDGHRGEHVFGLRRESETGGDAPMRGRARHVGALKAHCARDDRHKPGERLDQRRLAGAVGAEQRDDLARRDGERGAAHDRQPGLVARDQPLDLEHGSIHAAAPPR